MGTLQNLPQCIRISKLVLPDYETPLPWGRITNWARNWVYGAQDIGQVTQVSTTTLYSVGCLVSREFKYELELEWYTTFCSES